MQVQSPMVLDALQYQNQAVIPDIELLRFTLGKKRDELHYPVWFGGL